MAGGVRAGIPSGLWDTGERVATSCPDWEAVVSVRDQVNRVNSLVIPGQEPAIGCRYPHSGVTVR